MNLELPAASLISTLEPSVQYRYRVTNIDGVIVTLKGPEPLTPGHLVKFREGYVGLSLDSERVKIAPHPSKSPTEAQPYRFLTPIVPEVRVLQPLESVGNFRVVCATTGSVPPGYLGWGLEGPQGLVAVGNDYRSPGVLQASGLGLFPPGLYRLRVTRYTKPFLQPVTTVERSWELSEPTESLKAGGYNDVNAPVSI
jgi:hypothetical protein